ncbi:MAG: DUF4271 domain-containing protein [Bacteroidales bacterium]|nr:DUF4271 domain-containing protein [Bacteroidales bacterium]
MLAYIPYLVLFAFVCLLCNLYGLRREGILRRQVESLTDTKNERSFNDNSTNVLQLTPTLLILQWFVMAGLILYTSLSSDLFEDLRSPDEAVWQDLGVCVAIPAAWFVLQWVLYQWVTSLFHEGGRALILSRVYYAVHILSAPLALVAFLFELAGLLTPSDSIILLMLIFITAQMLFILSGIRIFWNGIVTLCYIILYLCTFKIAPLLIIFAKLG